MKIIVAGATGTAGAAIVKQCLVDDRITKVMLLTRKSLPKEIESNVKTEVLLHEDFSAYPEDVMQKFAGADACIWAIGGRVDQFHGDVDMCRKVGVEYTLAFANAVCQNIASKTTSGKPFRFVFCSGKYSEWDQTKSLWFMTDTRRIKGEVEKGLCDLADAHADALEVRILRPSGILEDDSSLVAKALGGLYGAIPKSQLGKVFVKVVCEGSKERIIENEEMLRM